MARYSDTDHFLDRWCVMEKLARYHLNKDESLGEFMEDLFHSGYLTSAEYVRFQTLRSFRNDLVHYYDADLQAEIAAKLPELTTLVEAVVRGYEALRESSPIRRVDTRIAPDESSPAEVKRKAPGSTRLTFDPEKRIPKRGKVPSKRPGDDTIITDRDVDSWARLFEQGKKKK